MMLGIYYCILLPLVNSQLTFFVIGDWGGTSEFPFTTEIQLRVASAMGNIAQQLKPNFVVSVGDNFYENGILNADDPRFQYTFESVYTDPFLQVEWYITPGNRDYYGNITGIFEYSYKSPRWNITALNYDYIFDIPNTNATMHLIQFNTWDLTSQSRSNVGAPPPDPARMVEAINYISDTLSKSTATWKVLLTHYPIWSAGAHGPNDIDLVNLLEPIILKNKPDCYLAGHDHALQHLTVNGLDYYIVGSGSDAANTWVGESGLPPDCLKFSYPPQNENIGGFASITITDTELKIDYYNDQGVLLYTSTKAPQPPITPPPPEPSPSYNPSVSPQPNKTEIRDDPALTGYTSVISESTLFGLVLGIVGGFLFIGATAVIVLMMKDRQKKILKLQRDQRH